MMTVLYNTSIAQRFTLDIQTQLEQETLLTTSENLSNSKAVLCSKKM